MAKPLFRVLRSRSNFKTPLSIVSLTITVLYVLYRIVLEESDLKLLQGGEVFVIVDKVVTYLFVLSLVALVLGIGASVATRIARSGRKPQTRKAPQGSSNDPYEYLDWEAVWDIVDPGGGRVQYTKNLTIRFLQPNVNVITDRVWGNGETMRDYQCSLGIPSDVFDFGNSKKALISLRENKKKGSEEKFTISRTILNGFTREEEWIEEEPGYLVKRYVLRMIFPRGRPCRRAVLTRRRANVTEELPRDAFNLRVDGRQEIRVFLRNLHRERILLRWWW